MTTQAGILLVIEALGLPSEARVNARVPKKLLVEQGAPTSADKRAIQDGIDELQWLAACKPSTIGVPSFADDAREYLEIAVVVCGLRQDAQGKRAKAGRLIELIHRAIPYPVFLVTTDVQGVTVSVAHKRHAQNESGKVVVERLVSVAGIRTEHLRANELAFLQSLSLAKQARRDLWTLYEGWLTRIEALNAARLTSVFATSDDVAAIERRREALEAHSRLTREITGLRVNAIREKQLSRRVELNLEIQAAHQQLQQVAKDM